MNEWILCSDRLPDDSGEYLVSVIDDEDEDYKHVGVAYFAHPNDYDIDKGEWRELMIDEKVIAWMPLPAPFEPQKSDIDNRKPCINYSDGCEEWAGCPCVYYKAESEEEK